MPWSELTRMQQRRRFIEALESCEYTMTELCAAYGIARKTGYKWAARYAREGWAGLEDRPRAPHSCPHATESHCVAALLAERRLHPSWGPRKLLARLRRRYPDWSWPAVSTAGSILRRHGLVVPRQKRARSPNAVSKPVVSACEPNDVWSADFKGEFRLGNRQLCYPLTVMDSVSRYLLDCRGRRSVAVATAQPVFERLFRTYGLPRAILCDNGGPFAAYKAPRRLSRLSVWWIRLGIEPIFIQPGHPEQNGAHERFHRTLKAATTRPPRENFRAQQGSFDDFRHEYNTERPHEALELTMPAEHYHRSARPYPGRLPKLEYPGHFEVRRVCSKGAISWRSQSLFLSKSLIRTEVGLEEVDDGLWSIYLADTLLARYDERDGGLQCL